MQKKIIVILIITSFLFLPLNNILKANVIKTKTVDEKQKIISSNFFDQEFYFDECKFKEYIIKDSFAVYSVQIRILNYYQELIKNTIKLRVKIGPGESDYRLIDLGKHYVDPCSLDYPPEPGVLFLKKEIYIISSDLEEIDEERYFAGSNVEALFFDYCDELTEKKTVVANYWHNTNSPDDQITAPQVITTKPQQKWIDTETFTSLFDQENLSINWTRYPEKETEELKNILSEFSFNQLDKYNDFDFINFKNDKISIINFPKYKDFYFSNVLENFLDSERMGWMGELAKYIGELTFLFYFVVMELGIGIGSILLIGICLEFLFGVIAGIYHGPSSLIGACIIAVISYILVIIPILTADLIIIPPSLNAFFQKCIKIKGWIDTKPWNNKIKLNIRVENLKQSDKLTLECRNVRKEYTVPKNINIKEWTIYVSPEESNNIKNNFSIHNCQVFLKINKKKQTTPKILSFAYSDGVIDWTFKNNVKDRKTKLSEKNRLNQIANLINYKMNHLFSKDMLINIMNIKNLTK